MVLARERDWLRERRDALCPLLPTALLTLGLALVFAHYLFLVTGYTGPRRPVRGLLWATNLSWNVRRPLAYGVDAAGVAVHRHARAVFRRKHPWHRAGIAATGRFVAAARPLVRRMDVHCLRGRPGAGLAGARRTPDAELCSLDAAGCRHRLARVLPAQPVPLCAGGHLHGILDGRLSGLCRHCRRADVAFRHAGLPAHRAAAPGAAGSRRMLGVGVLWAERSIRASQSWNSCATTQQWPTTAVPNQISLGQALRSCAPRWHTPTAISSAILKWRPATSAHGSGGCWY